MTAPSTELESPVGVRQSATRSPTVRNTSRSLVLEAFRGLGRGAWTRRDLAELTGLRVDHVSVVLGRLASAGEVEQATRCLWQLRPKDVIEEASRRTITTLHNLRAKAPMSVLTGTGVEPLLCDPTTPAAQDVPPPGWTADVLGDGKPYVQLERGSRLIRVDRGGPTVDLTLACSDEPMNVAEVREWLGELRGATGIDPLGPAWTVVMLEVNKDHRKVRLDGPNVFSLHSFIEGWTFKAYNKGKLGLRIESAWTSGASGRAQHVTLRDLLDLIEGNGSPSVPAELRRMSAEVRDLKSGIKEMAGELRRLRSAFMGRGR